MGYVAGVTHKKTHPSGYGTIEVTYQVLDNISVLESTDGTFYGWSGDLSGDTNPTTIVMDSDKDVTGNFSPIA